MLSTHLEERETLATINDEALEEKADAIEDIDEDSSSTTLLPDSPEPRRQNKADSGNATKLPSPETITTETLERHMYTAADPPLDIFVRTSAVERLSDFMLWQCHQNTQIFFLDCLWPDFDLKHFVWVLLEWQWRQKKTERDGRAVTSAPANKPQRLLD